MIDAEQKNYGPISQTSSFSRLFVSILYSKILDHLYKNSFLSLHQFGFLTLRSSCSQLFTCISPWSHSLSQDKPTHVIYTDISKAFNSVSHTKLLLVLKSYAIKSSVVSWLRNFLLERSQEIVINARTSI